MFDVGTGGRLYEMFLFGGLGFLLGLYYDAFRVARVMMHSGKRVIFLQDVFYCLSSALLFFLFTISVTGGRMRWYLFVGTFAGFFAYRLTVGRLVVKVARRVIEAVVWLWSRFWRLALAPFRWIFRLIRKPLQKFTNCLQIWTRRCGSFLKKGLKSLVPIVYNKQE